MISPAAESTCVTVAAGEIKRVHREGTIMLSPALGETSAAGESGSIFFKAAAALCPQFGHLKMYRDDSILFAPQLSAKTTYGE